MAKTVLVTGGSGYIAGFLIKQLIAEGWTVRTTIRNLKREAEVRGWLGIADPERLTFFAADLEHDAGWAEAVAGCSHVAHVASPFPAAAPKSDDELVVPAREGALRALRFAKTAGVERFVLTSSVAAIGYGQPERVYTEDDWTDVDAPGVGAYIKSKTIAERAARDWIAANGSGMEFVSINPSAVLGPLLSDDYSASIQFVQRIIDGSVPGTPRLGFAVVDVRDLADLHVRALTTPGIDGERFIAAGKFLWMREVAAILRARFPTAKVPTRSIPDFVVRIMALFDSSLRQITGELGRRRDVSPEHTAARMGWRTRDEATSIIDTAQSLIDRGLVKLKV